MDTGYHINDIFIGCPTVADDAALLSDDTVDLQIMLNVSEGYSKQNRYPLNATKSLVNIKSTNSARKKESAFHEWYLGDSVLPVAEEYPCRC